MPESRQASTSLQDEMVDQLLWLVANSQGVKGLRSDLTIMPWSQVIDLYVPALKEQVK